MKSNKISMIEYVIMLIITSLIVFHLLGVQHLFVALFALIIVSYFPNLKQKQFYILGKISYSLYLIHSLTGSVLINVFSHYFTQSYQKPILIISGLIISISASYVMYFFIEKPSQKLAASIKYKSFS
jgi:peptidoglycan/LPS O-acetylase OafA/YrhL